MLFFLWSKMVAVVQWDKSAMYSSTAAGLKALIGSRFDAAAFEPTTKGQTVYDFLWDSMGNAGLTISGTLDRLSEAQLKTTEPFKSFQNGHVLSELSVFQMQKTRYDSATETFYTNYSVPTRGGSQEVRVAWTHNGGGLFSTLVMVRDTPEGKGRRSSKRENSKPELVLHAQDFRLKSEFTDSQRAVICIDHTTLSEGTGSENSNKKRTFSDMERAFRSSARHSISTTFGRFLEFFEQDAEITASQRSLSVAADLSPDYVNLTTVTEKMDLTALNWQLGANQRTFRHDVSDQFPKLNSRVKVYAYGNQRDYFEVWVDNSPLCSSSDPGQRLVFKQEDFYVQGKRKSDQTVVIRVPDSSLVGDGELLHVDQTKAYNFFSLSESDNLQKVKPPRIDKSLKPMVFKPFDSYIAAPDVEAAIERFQELTQTLGLDLSAISKPAYKSAPPYETGNLFFEMPDHISGGRTVAPCTVKAYVVIDTPACLSHKALSKGEAFCLDLKTGKISVKKVAEVVDRGSSKVDTGFYPKTCLAGVASKVTHALHGIDELDQRPIFPTSFKGVQPGDLFFKDPSTGRCYLNYMGPQDDVSGALFSAWTVVESPKAGLQLVAPLNGQDIVDKFVSFDRVFHVADKSDAKLEQTFPMYIDGDNQAWNLFTGQKVVVNNPDVCLGHQLVTGEIFSLDPASHMVEVIKVGEDDAEPDTGRFYPESCLAKPGTKVSRDPNHGLDALDALSIIPRRYDREDAGSLFFKDSKSSNPTRYYMKYMGPGETGRYTSWIASTEGLRLVKPSGEPTDKLLDYNRIVRVAYTKDRSFEKTFPMYIDESNQAWNLFTGEKVENEEDVVLAGYDREEMINCALELGGNRVESFSVLSEGRQSWFKTLRFPTSETQEIKPPLLILAKTSEGPVKTPLALQLPGGASQFDLIAYARATEDKLPYYQKGDRIARYHASFPEDEYPCRYYINIETGKHFTLPDTIDDLIPVPSESLKPLRDAVEADMVAHRKKVDEKKKPPTLKLRGSDAQRKQDVRAFTVTRAQALQKVFANEFSESIRLCASYCAWETSEAGRTKVKSRSEFNEDDRAGVTPVTYEQLGAALANSPRVPLKMIAVGVEEDTEVVPHHFFNLGLTDLEYTTYIEAILEHAFKKAQPTTEGARSTKPALVDKLRAYMQFDLPENQSDIDQGIEGKRSLVVVEFQEDSFTVYVQESDNPMFRALGAQKAITGKIERSADGGQIVLTDGLRAALKLLMLSATMDNQIEHEEAVEDDRLRKSGSPEKCGDGKRANFLKDGRMTKEDCKSPGDYSRIGYL